MINLKNVPSELFHIFTKDIVVVDEDVGQGHLDSSSSNIDNPQTTGHTLVIGPPTNFRPLDFMDLSISTIKTPNSYYPPKKGTRGKIKRW